MDKLKQAARQALEALIEANVVAERYQNADKRKEAITALREALANTRSSIRSTSEYSEQAEQEPVAWWNGKETVWFEHELITDGPVGECKIPLYAAPVHTKDLTDDEIQEVMMSIPPTGIGYFLRIARAVIAAYKEKNK